MQFSLSRLIPGSRQLIRFGISAGVLVLFFIHVSGMYRMGLITQVESFFYDMRVRLTMPGTIDERIVIVDLDDASLQEIHHWPWPRNILADLINRLFDDYWVESVGFDVLFSEPDDSSALALLRSLCESRAGDTEFVERECEPRMNELNTDQLFGESMIARDAVLGMVFDNSLSDGMPKHIGELPTPILKQEQIADLEVPFITARGYVAPLPVLQSQAATTGFFDNPLPDADGVVRRVPLVQRYDGDIYQSLAVALARIRLGNPPLQFVFSSPDPARRTGIDLEAIRLGDQRVSVDQNVAVMVPYRGPLGSFPYVSAKDVLQGTADAETLEGAIVLVGTSAAGLLDLRATPVGRIFNGVEVHANIVSGILDGRFKHRPDYTRAVEIFTFFVLGLLLAVLLPVLSPVWEFVLVLFLAVGVLGGNLALWEYYDLVLPLAPSILYLLTATFLHLNYGFFVESANKRRLSGMFGQYVPPELVEEMDQQDSEISLEGQNREMSVLFSDVRGFTTISEGLSPKELTQFMNDFLTPITEVIHRNRGTIDKYMGDAVMAFWGAPLEDPDHARHALQAALQMNKAMETLSAEFLEMGRPELKIGIGINTGMMNVGNMGSRFRMAYTVLGDAVNLGSRLEGLTKNYGVTTIVSEYTAKAVPDFLFRELDRVRVKGKKEPVTIFEPVGLDSEVDAAQKSELDRYHDALKKYLSQRWDAATDELKTLNAEAPRFVYEVYLARIEDFKASPPGDDWDGVYTMTTK
ncbi:MAG: adenylate/guanylate cyclase domain-containing protein [Gammaproteobacteria bacterium]|nr:adenylate/guanylate cyclase domain-containing protein [Gammaproteobacteria bacterium]